MERSVQVDPAGDRSRTRPGRTRVAWIDAARGFLVVLVVVGHAMFFMGRGGMPVTELEPAVRVAQAVRIPGLFALSGALFHHAATRPWRTVLGTRIVPMLWVLGVWLLIELAVWSARFSTEVAMPEGPARWVVDQALLPEDYLWFIWSLALMTVVARLLRRWPVVLGGLAVVMWLSPVLPDLGKQTVPMFSYAPFFLLGFLLAPALRARPRWIVVAGTLSALAFIPLAVARNELDVVLTDTRVDLVVTALVGLPAVALLGLGLSRMPGGGIWSWFGRRTLAIYVAHMPLLLLGMGVLEGPARPLAEAHPGVTLVVVLVYAVGLSVLLHAVTERLPFDGILAEPRWLRALVLGRDRTAPPSLPKEPADDDADARSESRGPDGRRTPPG